MFIIAGHVTEHSDGDSGKKGTVRKRLNSNWEWTTV